MLVTALTKVLQHLLPFLVNFYASFTKESGRKVLLGIIPQLVHMAVKDYDAPSVPFGEGTVDCIQK